MSTPTPTKRLTWNPFRLAVLRWKMTEPAMTSHFNYGTYNNDPEATFHCAYCNHTLFPALAKYNSGTGWPSFWRTFDANAVSYHREWDGRLECVCANCHSHLGHVFMDGPYPSTIPNQYQELVQSIPSTDPKSKKATSTNQCLPRFCINGLALTYHKKQPSASSQS
jgi:peptide-methionine (R)-S-oxide reductase